MNYKNKLLASSLLFITSFSFAFADNKSDLLSTISSLKTEISSVKTTQTTSLEDKVSVLSTWFDQVYTSLGYTASDVSYLVSLWKLTTNYKQDLINEFASLKSEISTKTTTQNDSLISIEDNIKYNYATISDNQKTTFLSSINAIDSEVKNLNSTFQTKISALNTKYTANLATFKSSVKTAFESNTTSISALKNFASKYEALYSINQEFNKNYESFKTNYLSYASELKSFWDERQAYYVEFLKAELEKIRDTNITANPSLATYKTDIDRMIDLLLENFKNSLSIKMDESYGVVFSEADINSLISKFNSVKNRYYDTDGNLKATEVLSNNSWTLEEISYLTTNLWDINSKIKNISSTGSATLANIKVNLENEMVKYYNANYNGYREDLLLKLKEKLNIVSLEAKNVILAADTIDLRFSLLNDKISKSNDIKYINDQIATFKSDVAKYSYLNSSVLNTKVSNLNINLWLFTAQKELGFFKYNKMSQATYKTQLDKILAQLKAKYPETYKTKLLTLVDKIDNLLNNSKLNDKTRFMLLVVKLNVLNFVK